MSSCSPRCRSPRPSCSPPRRHPAPSREIDNVAAFARLYGVVRFFYPSDAAAELDWNRFAVHGVSRVRAARNAAELEAALQQLVAPARAGHRDRRPPPAGRRAATATGEPLVAWRYLGPGFSTHGRRLPGQAHPPGGSRADGRLRHADADGAGRGPSREGDPPARAGAGHRRGCRGAAGRCGCASTGRTRSWASSTTWATGRSASREWRSYAIEGTVADDAENVAFGVMAMGSGDRRLRRRRAGGQGRDGRLDAGPDPGRGLRGGGRRREGRAGSARGRRTRRSRDRPMARPRAGSTCASRRRRRAPPTWSSSRKAPRLPERTPTSTSGRASGPACRSR